jgi:thymidine phosphorylase
MTAVLGMTTEQAITAFLFIEIAKKHGIDVDFDFSDYRNPQVNFIGGTREQHEALAMELAQKFQEV